ncbi:MAG: hypothetical protein LBD45_05330 [Bacteroidales bacterium]|nr:hypothetical protein [Bacteroidales bacterium]
MYITAVAMIFIAFNACETAEDISNSMDHETPSCIVFGDSLWSPPGETVEIAAKISDNSGLGKLEFSYGEWMIRESVSFAELNFPKSYIFRTTFVIPANAQREWQEEVIEKTGSRKVITQRYHKLLLEITDINMNVLKVPVHVRVYPR